MTGRRASYSRLFWTTLLGAALCAAPAVAADTIKLGVAGAFSGDLASYGIPSKRAAELAVAEINARGGILGRQVEILAEDDACKPELATNTATRLVSRGAQIVLGHICSGATKTALGVYRDAGLVVLSPSATSPELMTDRRNTLFFRTIAPDDAQAKLAAEFTLSTLQAKKIALLHDKGDYGKGFAEFARRFLVASGRASVVLFEGVTPGAVDYSAVIQKVRQAGADAVIYGGYHPEAASLVGTMKKRNLAIPFVSDDGVKDATFIKVAGSNAEGVYATGPKDMTKNPLAAAAIAAHRKAYAADPGAFYLNAYAGTHALLAAVEKAGGTEAAAVAAALRSHPVDTALGTIRFDARGEAIGIGFSVYQVENGQYVERPAGTAGQVRAQKRQAAGLDYFLELVFGGLTRGSIYALIALGYTMVYGCIGLINFAHGEIYMIGAFVALIASSVLTAAGLPMPAVILTALALSVVFAAAHGYAVEKIAYRPLRNAPRLSPLISAIGMSVFLQNYVMLAQTSDFLPFPNLLPELPFLEAHAPFLPATAFFILAVTAVLMVALTLLLKFTRLGKSMRAIAQDRVMAMLVGVPVDRTISATFILGSILAAVGGFLIASHVGRINFFIGFLAGIKAFTAAVLGGIGSIPGAVLGALVLGLTESFAAGYISSDYEDVFAFGLLILLLIVRPSGLLGRRVVTKV